MNSNAHDMVASQATPDFVKDVDITKALRSIWAGKLLIASTALLFGLVFALYAVFVAEAKFSSYINLMLESRNNQVVNIESVLSGTSTEVAAINTELQVIKSRRVLQQVLQRLDLVNDPEFNGALKTPSMLSPSRLKGLVVGLLMSREASEPSTEETLWDVTDALADAISVSAKRDTYLIQIGVTTGSAAKSALIANTLAGIYLENQVTVKFEATQYAVDWLSDKVSELEFELKRREEEVRQLRSESNLISFEALELSNVRAKDLRERIADLVTDVEAADARLGLLRQAGTMQPREAANLLDDAILTRLVNTAANGNAEARSAFNARVAALVTQAEAARQRSESQRAALEGSYEQLQADIEKQSGDLIRIEQTDREIQATRVLYETFLARLKETSVQIGLQTADSRVLSDAIPGHPVAPRRTMLTAMGLFLGAILGIAVLLGREMFHDRFRTVEELEQATRRNVFAQIPKVPVSRRQEMMDYLLSRPTSAAAEAIRNLRTSVLMTNFGKPPKVIMLTSSVPGEGKTTLSIALAHNLAGLGHRVLLMEGDIRRRSFTNYFENAGETGLLSVMTRAVPLSDAVHHAERLGIDVLMGEVTKASAVDEFSSVAFRQVMDEAREAYDFVVIDTPPVNVVPDARVVAPLADAVLYCVHWDHTDKNQVLSGLREFSSVGVAVTGLVLSQVSAVGMKRYGYGYGAYSAYGNNGYYDR